MDIKLPTSIVAEKRHKTRKFTTLVYPSIEILGVLSGTNGVFRRMVEIRDSILEGYAYPSLFSSILLTNSEIYFHT